MKIIGIGEDTVILEAGRREVANLLNLYSNYDKGMPKLIPNMDIDIQSLYHSANSYKNALRHEKFDDIREALQTMLDIITPLQVVAETVNKEINEEV